MNIIVRQPIVTVAGHIDHGKTTFLNYINKCDKVIKEHGGITQHIKSYNIKTIHGGMTFLDTPGHFAFNYLRENSIKYSDIVLLIIAIDDGIKPQTIESLNIAKKFNVPVIVAVNKVDKINKVKFDYTKLLNDLSNVGLVSEKWGGDTFISYISAKTGEGIDDLLSLIKLHSDMLDLRVNDDNLTYGIILDNRIDLGLGLVTTLIVKNGKLKKGDEVVVSNEISKIKSIFDDNNRSLKEALPSLPVCVTGLSSGFEIGEKFFSNKNNKVSETVHVKSSVSVSNKTYDLNYLIDNLKRLEQIKINLIVKVDVQGSLFVLKESLAKLSNDKIKVNIVKIEMGTFNKSDIDLAILTSSLLIGFNIKISSKIIKLVLNNSLILKNFNVIYDVINFIEEKISNIDKNDKVDTIIGKAEIKKIFNSGKNNIAGCFITYGKIKTGASAKIIRKDLIVYNGSIDCIKIYKNIVPEVKTNSECGITLKDYNDFQVGDIIKTF